MSERPAQPAPRPAIYEDDARQRIRRALLRYLETQAIGVPKLQSVIAATTRRSVDLIPLKTLQRFLKGEMRTNDVMVGICADFVASLPMPRITEDFGDMMMRFLAADNPGVLEEASVAPGLPPNMRVVAERVAPTVNDSDPKGIPRVHHSRLMLDPVPHGRFSVVREELADDGGHARAEGVLFERSGNVFALLRDNLTGLPKVYTCGRTTEGALLQGAVERRVSAPAYGVGAFEGFLHVENRDLLLFGHVTIGRYQPDVPGSGFEVLTVQVWDWTNFKPTNPD